MSAPKRLQDPVQIVAGLQFRLPLQLTFRASKSVGSGAKEIMWVCLLGLGLVIFSNTGPDSHMQKILFSLGVIGAGLVAYSKQKKYQNVLFEIVLDENFLFLSKNLVKKPERWKPLSEGNFLKLPWDDITAWRFENVSAESGRDLIASTGSGANEYWIQLKQFPSTYLVIDRELVLDVEDEFITVAKRILAGQVQIIPGVT